MVRVLFSIDHREAFPDLPGPKLVGETRWALARYNRSVGGSLESVTLYFPVVTDPTGALRVAEPSRNVPNLVQLDATHF
jgi:hypothetical protein